MLRLGLGLCKSPSDFTTHFTTDPKWTGEKMLKAAYPLGEDSNWSRVRKGGTKVGAEEEE